MTVNLAQLASQVKEDLDAYEVPQTHPSTALGSPLPASWYEAGLAAMRTSLVEPYWTKLRDLDPDSRKLVILDVVVVADDGDGSLVAFDPMDQGGFVLALREPDPEAGRGINTVSCGVRGDAVGCFLSR
jgi:hypothetical protein